jgi:hypothetical protein
MAARTAVIREITGEHAGRLHAVYNPDVRVWMLVEVE